MSTIYFFQTRARTCISVVTLVTASASASAVDTIASQATQVITAANCSFEAVQAAGAAAAPGYTVMIPKGDCKWGANQLTLPGGVTIKGAGRDLTILRRTAAVPVNTYMIKYDCWNGKKAVVSDMTFVGAMIPNSEDRGLGLINGCVDFKVTNTKFYRFTFAGIEVRGSVKQRGVIYKNQFVDNYNPGLRNLGYGVVVFGDGTWPALELGSANAVFVEDNYMLGNRHHIAANNGARYVFRYNTVEAKDVTKDFAMVDAHGLSSAPTGTRSWEIYKNSFMARLTGTNKVFSGIGIRGGDGIIADNTFSSSIARPIFLQLEWGTACDSTYVQYQVRQAYIWSNTNATVTSHCPLTIAQNREYFVGVKPGGYKPYQYPHPLRAL